MMIPIKMLLIRPSIIAEMPSQAHSILMVCTSTDLMVGFASMWAYLSKNSKPLENP